MAVGSADGRAGEVGETEAVGVGSADGRGVKSGETDVVPVGLIDEHPMTTRSISGIRSGLMGPYPPTHVGSSVDGAVGVLVTTRPLAWRSRMSPDIDPSST